MGLLRSWKNHHEKVILNKATKLFLNGKIDKATRLLQNFEYKRSGDVAAIHALASAKNDTLDHARQTYHNLWEAKLSYLINADLATAVDTALGTVTPLVMERAKDDIRTIHKYFTDGDKEALFAACEEHVAYGHPDAIALQIAGYLQFGFESNDTSETYCYNYHTQLLYNNWFYELQRAKRKGFSNDTEPLADQTLEKLRLLGGDGIISDPVPSWPEEEPPFNSFGWQ